MYHTLSPPVARTTQHNLHFFSSLSILFFLSEWCRALKKRASPHCQTSGIGWGGMAINILTWVYILNFLFGHWAHVNHFSILSASSLRSWEQAFKPHNLIAYHFRQKFSLTCCSIPLADSCSFLAWRTSQNCKRAKTGNQINMNKNIGFGNQKQNQNQSAFRFNTQGSQLALERHPTNTSTKTWVALGNNHLACESTEHNSESGTGLKGFRCWILTPLSACTEWVGRSSSTQRQGACHEHAARWWHSRGHPQVQVPLHSKTGAQHAVVNTGYHLWVTEPSAKHEWLRKYTDISELQSNVQSMIDNPNTLTSVMGQCAEHEW